MNLVDEVDSTQRELLSRHRALLKIRSNLKNDLASCKSQMSLVYQEQKIYENETEGELMREVKLGSEVQEMLKQLASRMKAISKLKKANQEIKQGYQNMASQMHDKHVAKTDIAEIES